MPVDQAPSAMASTMAPAVRLRGVSKRYATRDDGEYALRDVSLDIAAGEAVAIVGPSGSGKTTLIHLLTGIDAATQGDVSVAGTRLDALKPAELTRWRGRHIGLVFQSFQLLPTLTALENVMLPMELCGDIPPAQRRERAMALLERLGIADQAGKLPADMSGGQQQRTAVARALANDPPLVVADEPTGNLDSRTGEAVLALLAGLSAEGRTVIAVTHEREHRRFFPRSIALSDGRVAPECTAPGAGR